MIEFLTLPATSGGFGIWFPMLLVIIPVIIAIDGYLTDSRRTH